jgi:hypothetical protein
VIRASRCSRSSAVFGLFVSIIPNLVPGLVTIIASDCTGLFIGTIALSIGLIAFVETIYLLGEIFELDSKSGHSSLVWSAGEEWRPAFGETKRIEFRVGALKNLAPSIGGEIGVEVILNAQHVKVKELNRLGIMRI